MWIFDLRTYVIMFIILAILKVSGAVAIGWLWVFSPIIAYFSAALLIIIVSFGILFFGFNLFDKVYKGEIKFPRIDF